MEASLETEARERTKALIDFCENFTTVSSQPTIEEIRQFYQKLDTWDKKPLNDKKLNHVVGKLGAFVQMYVNKKDEGRSETAYKNLKLFCDGVANGFYLNENI